MYKWLLIVSTLLTALSLSIEPALANTPEAYDISYPQCGKAYPSETASFGIVGINGGIASNANPCLSSELIWMTQLTGPLLNGQPKTQVYVNTGKPGLRSDLWPTSNYDPSGAVAPDIYGTCDGSNTMACAWQYGWNRAYDDVNTIFANAATTPAAISAGVSANPTRYTWWLDVEKANTWNDAKKDTADLEGMTAYFTKIGAQVGIYATLSQWQGIIGKDSVSQTSNLYSLDNWMPGNADISSAGCGQPKLTAGTLKITQQISAGSIDADFSCLP